MRLYIYGVADSSNVPVRVPLGELSPLGRLTQGLPLLHFWHILQGTRP